MQAYLGVGVEAVPSALEKQLPTLNNQGVLIAEVAKDSPAQHAGLKPYDILVSYDDHQLYSPEQLVKLVQNDKPGRAGVPGRGEPANPRRSKPPWGNIIQPK